MSQVSIVIDLPGKFDSFFSGSTVGQSAEGYSHDPEKQAGAERLNRAYKAAQHRKVGKGYSLRLALDGTADEVFAALDVLDAYGDACIVANRDAAEDRYSDPSDRSSARAEMAAGAKVMERVEKAAEQVRLQRG